MNHKRRRDDDGDNIEKRIKYIIHSHNSQVTREGTIEEKIADFIITKLYNNLQTLCNPATYYHTINGIMFIQKETKIDTISYNTLLSIAANCKGQYNTDYSISYCILNQQTHLMAITRLGNITINTDPRIMNECFAFYIYKSDLTVNNDTLTCWDTCKWHFGVLTYSRHITDILYDSVNKRQVNVNDVIFGATSYAIIYYSLLANDNKLPPFIRCRQVYDCNQQVADYHDDFDPEPDQPFYDSTRF
jgi:hypothetical protein